MNMVRKMSRSLATYLPLLLASIVFCDAGAQEIECSEVGKFSIPDSCQEYVECKFFRGRLYSGYAVCPSGTMFDDILSECTPDDILTSPLQCKVETTPIEMPVDTPSEITKAEDVSGFEELTVCELLNAVESYTNLVSTSPPMRKSFTHQTQYNRYITRYNMDLEIAQNHTFPWKFGDNIFTGIRNTYQEADAYTGEFQRKLRIVRNRILAVSTQDLNEKHLDKLKKDIQSLQNETEGAQEALKVIKSTAVRQYFEKVISDKTMEIENKQQQIKSYTKEGLILKELIDFLGFVRDDAEEVEKLATQRKLQLISLKENFGVDAKAFDRYTVMTGEDIRILSEELESLEDALIGIEAQEEQLEREKTSLNDQFNALNIRNTEIKQNVAELVSLMGNKSDTFYQLQESLCRIDGPISSMINENSTSLEILNACKSILRQEGVNLDTTAEESQIKNLRQEARRNRKQIKRISNRIGFIIDELRMLFGTISPQKTRMDEIEVEITSLQSHASDLATLQEGINTAVKVLLKLGEELLDLQVTFESISGEIQSMIGQVHAAMNIDNKLQQRLATEQAIYGLQINLEHLSLPDIKNC